MEKQITNEELRELERCLAPIENRMDKVVKDYVLSSRSHAAVSPRDDWGAYDVFDDTYDMQTVYELLNFFKGLIETHGGLPSFTPLVLPPPPIN